MALANTFQFNCKVSLRTLDVEYIYDLNNINLSIKHMDLFIWAGCAYAAKYFSNICPGRVAF